MDGFMFPQNHSQQNAPDKSPSYSIPTIPQVQHMYDNYHQQQMNYQPQQQKVYNYQQPQVVYHPQNSLNSILPPAPQSNNSNIYIQNNFQPPPNDNLLNRIQNTAQQFNQNRQQLINPNSYHQHIQHNPLLLEYVQRFAQNQLLQNSLSQMNFKPQKPQTKPPPNPNDPPKKRGRPRKIDTEYTVVVPKQKKKETKEASGNDFESFADDYIPKDLIALRTEVRENRRHINYNEDEDFEDFDDEDDTSISVTNNNTQRIEKIYASRSRSNQTEYLIKFQESELCQWIPENQMPNYSNSKSLLQRYNLTPLVIPENSPLTCIVAHRFNGINYEYLFKFTYETNMVFYWDHANESQAKLYFQNRVQVPLINPPIPTVMLPLPTTKTIVSKPEGSEMREYQLEGLKWLLQCWKAGHGSILADEMGLGKTIQILSFLSYLNKQTNWHGPFLITVRTNCFKQWCDEIERWTNLRYIAYNSGPAQRKLMRTYMFPFLDTSGNPIPNVINFNILLISYDVLLKDVAFLNQYLWEVLVVDEGHRIKNSTGKKNNAMSNLKAKQRIILTGTPIQNSLGELWTLLRFVSPSYFSDTPSWLENDVDSLSPETVKEARNMIHPHLLRRSLSEAERTIAPKEERVAFISLTRIQKEMIRLIKLHKLWRIKGIQTSEVEIDSSHETNAIQKVCSHPFLVEGAEEFYSKKFNNLSRLELILACSSKFQWLDVVLKNLHHSGHKILIFSQRVKLLVLLQEYCNLRGYKCQMLIGQMGETEKNASIAKFSAEDSDDFIFLISTRAGSEGLNLTVANTTIIFDPDWNPQNDLQAQGRCHRIGQTQKVDVLRLITYQTYEHEMFVRAQRKLGLWLTLLGSEPINEKSNLENPEPPLKEPPEIVNENGFFIINEEEATSINLSDLLPFISTVATDFSLPALDRLEAPLKQPIDYSDGTPDDAFIESFPVEVDDGYSRRAKRSRSRELSLDQRSALLIYEKLKVYGYGHIEPIAALLPDHAIEQVEQFAVNLIIFAFRALNPQSISYFPVLIKQLLTDYPEYQLKILFCSNKHHWIDLSENEQEIDIDIQPIRFLRDELFNKATEFLSIIEMKLIAHFWLQLEKQFPFEKLAPPPIDPNNKNGFDIEKDKEIFNNIVSYELFDPFIDRVMVIINYMRTDLILSHKDSCAYHFSWWTEPEFLSIVSTLRNFPFSTENPIELHSKTCLLSKATTETLAFTAQLRRMCLERRKGQIIIPKGLHKLLDAPETVANQKVTWTTIQSKTSDEIKSRIELLNRLKNRLNELEMIPKNEDELEDDENNLFWTDSCEKRLFQLILTYGLDSMNSILIDKRFGFLKLFSVADIQFLRGEKIRRSSASTDIPDWVFSLSELSKYLSNTDRDQVKASSVGSGAFDNPYDLSDDEWRVEFALPQLKKITFVVNNPPKNKKKSGGSIFGPGADNDSYMPSGSYRVRGNSKKKNQIETDSDDSFDNFIID